MFIVNKRKIFYTISIIIIGLCIGAISKYGLNFGIDFTGGSVIEVQYAGANDFPSAEVVKQKLSDLEIGESVVRQTNDNGYIIRTKALNEEQRKTVTASLGGEVKKLDLVGPVLGRELREKAILSIILVVLAIVLFITFVFRKVSKPVSSWKYGSVAIVALLHDVIVPAGLFAFLGRNGGYELDALFITALLVILGFSIHDTIVVFDRTRENIKNIGLDKKSFGEIVGMSLTQTMSRSINTTLTTMFALIALFFFGPETTKNFSLVLIIGITAGVYSSVFIASPLLVTLEKFQSKGKKA
jgi:preprotein translocase subunit SecF